MSKNILVLNGPNLNMLGIRETSIYGSLSLTQLQQQLTKDAEKYSINLKFLQTNSEEKMLTEIHDSFKKIDFIIINPAAWTHTSIALRDAFLSVSIPFVEVHISNIYKRESFRHHSYLSDIAEAVISGMGLQGYKFALEFAFNYLNRNK